MNQQCRDCGNEYPLASEYWHKNTQQKSGFNPRCKTCANKRSAEYKARNPEKERERAMRASKKWRDNNPDKRRETLLLARHKYTKYANLPSDFTRRDWWHALEYFNHSCAVCSKTMDDCTLAIDHWQPLSKGGGTIPENIVPLCHGIGGCNNKKSNQDPAVWLTETFGARKAAVILARIAAFFASVRQSQQKRSKSA